MYKSILNRIEKIKKLNSEIDEIQNKCKHENVAITYGSNTGNYDPSADIWWTNYHCSNCDKRWSIYTQ